MNKNLLTFAMFLTSALVVPHARAESLFDLLRENEAAKQAQIKRVAELKRGEYLRGPVDVAGFTHILKGKLTLAPGRSLRLRDENGSPFAFADGPVTLTFGAADYDALWSNERRVSVAQGGRAAAFRTLKPEKGGFSFGSLVTLPTGGQGIVLRGAKTVERAGEFERTGSEYCTHASYCLHPATSGGHFTMKFGFYYACAGHRSVLEHVETFRALETADLLSVADRAVVATVAAQPVMSEKVTKLRTLNACH